MGSAIGGAYIYFRADVRPEGKGGRHEGGFLKCIVFGRFAFTRRS